MQTSLIPRSPPPPMEDTEHERSSVSDYEDANEAGPAAFIKEEALPQQSDSTDTPAASRSGALWLGERQNNLRVPRVILTRTLKSVVLIAKVRPIANMSLQHSGRPKYILRRCFPFTKYAVTMVLYFSKPWFWGWLSSTLGLIVFRSHCCLERSTWSYCRFFVNGGRNDQA